MHDMLYDAKASDRMSLRAGQRNVLLLQGLVGPFFRQLGRALRQEGYGVFKVNFNGGDRLFWAQSKGSINYTGTLAAWPAALSRIISANQITDVLLFGDCRPVHRAAIALCARLRIAVHVCDEGYIRPDWVTFELGGVNGNSELPCDPEYYLQNARHLPPPLPHQPVRSSFRRRALEAVAYDTANILCSGYFPHWRNHRPRSALQEGFSWLGRLWGARQAKEAASACLRRLQVQDAPYMLLPLQLDSDAQIRFHSGYGSMADPISLVLQSFAAHAPPELRLLVKAHPLDNGLCDYRAIVDGMASALGIAGRVDYIDGGDIALIVRAARGLVTVNSTTGTLALAFGVPVITLGHAVYDMPGITAQNGLDAFWSDPGVPDAPTFEAFQRVLIDRCLVAGGFFSVEALDKVVHGVVARLKAHCPIDFSQLGIALERPRLRNAKAARRELVS